MFQPYHEKESERELVRYFSRKTASKIQKMQEDNDDGGTDAIIEYQGKEIYLEVRRKGFPNHRG
jgi:hypothetical protein